MKNLFFILLLSILFFSCTENDALEPVNKNDKIDNISQKEAMMSNFAGILSKVIYERQDVREFVKEEALKQFDKNYDVLYANIKNEKINGMTFRDIMVSYSSDSIMSTIEANVPLLNILFPEIQMFGISPKDYNSLDNDIPVAISKKSKTSLFFNGKCTDNLEKGEVPDFYVLVVNENSRVIMNTTRSNGPVYRFKSPNFDGTKNKQNQTITRSVTEDSSIVGNKAISAYQYFNKNDGSKNSTALQRDYIYYGITPEHTSGTLNLNVSEYISFIEINPNAYFKISDQKTGSISDDPWIENNSATRKKRDFTEQELIDKLWTKGAYDFRIEVITSTKDYPQILYIPLKPNEIWNFNLDRSYRHSTAFRHSKYTYRINPDKFTSKRVYLTPEQISFGKWNLAEESIYRYVTFIEEDESVETTISYTYETTKVNSTKFSGNAKLDLGLGDSDKLSGDVNTEVSNNNTVKGTKNITIKRNEDSDNLGSVKIYFYDPIIESKISNTTYRIRTYNTGTVTFGITAF